MNEQITTFSFNFFFYSSCVIHIDKDENDSDITTKRPINV